MAVMLPLLILKWWMQKAAVAQQMRIRVDFSVSGPVIWRGGFNAAKLNTTNNLYLDTECGINRVAVRSTLTPGKISITATRKGLTSATVTIDSKPVDIIDGLTLVQPQSLK